MKFQQWLWRKAVFLIVSYVLIVSTFCYREIRQEVSTLTCRLWVVMMIKAKREVGGLMGVFAIFTSEQQEWQKHSEYCWDLQ